MTIREFQASIHAQYFQKDSARGVGGTFLWFVEEIGELAEALRHGTLEEKRAEFADVLAWLSTLASMAGVDLEEAAAAKYGKGCPRCGGTPCACKEPDAATP
ncbi:MAG: MazG nucleotide pyrophosphohydrolase domain-containing protein [Planctomycetota bacterium]